MIFAFTDWLRAHLQKSKKPLTHIIDAVGQEIKRGLDLGSDLQYQLNYFPTILPKIISATLCANKHYYVTTFGKLNGLKEKKYSTTDYDFFMKLKHFTKKNEVFHYGFL